MKPTKEVVQEGIEELRELQEFEGTTGVDLGHIKLEVAEDVFRKFATSIQEATRREVRDNTKELQYLASPAAEAMVDGVRLTQIIKETNAFLSTLEHTKE